MRSIESYEQFLQNVKFASLSKCHIPSNDTEPGPFVITTNEPVLFGKLLVTTSWYRIDV